MRLLEAGTLDPTPLVSDRIRLEDAPEGYERFDRRLATKVLIEP
jgi:threonine dehydrogenase-like Zn-dependent dehydrogenase